MHKGKTGHDSEKVAICEPGREASQETNPAGTSWTSCHNNCEEINVCRLSHPVCGILLWWPKQINTATQQQFSSLSVASSGTLSEVSIT